MLFMNRYNLLVLIDAVAQKNKPLVTYSTQTSLPVMLFFYI
ncbi:hypothetical protein DSUL_60324 [Desulfovibrionales bacterium]